MTESHKLLEFSVKHAHLNFNVDIKLFLCYRSYLNELFK